MPTKFFLTPLACIFISYNLCTLAAQTTALGILILDSGSDTEPYAAIFSKQEKSLDLSVLRPNTGKKTPSHSNRISRDTDPHLECDETDQTDPFAYIRTYLSKHPYTSASKDRHLMKKKVSDICYADGSHSDVFYKDSPSPIARDDKEKKAPQSAHAFNVKKRHRKK